MTIDDGIGGGRRNFKVVQKLAALRPVYEIYDEQTGEPKPKKEYKSDDKKDFKKDFKKSDKDDKWAKKKKEPNKYLGKDENGKAIFSGKSGERNHRHDGTTRDASYPPKKVGRKINIKSLKKSEDKED